MLFERAPHQLLEGLLIASYAIGSANSFIFIRGEYQIQYEALQKAIAEAEKAGLIGENILGSKFSCRIQLMRGAGAYISGLDTALLETMEGKKAWPRQPPPFPTVAGLMAKPTVVNNVETFCAAAHIAARGGAWFASIGTPHRPSNCCHMSGSGRFRLSPLMVFSSAGSKSRCGLPLCSR